MHASDGLANMLVEASAIPSSKYDLSDRANNGYARKLVNMWYGLYRVAELYEEHVMRLKIAVTLYRLFVMMYIL